MLRKPKIILIGGVPGVGKSAIAIELARRLNIDQVIHTDTLREVLKLNRHTESDKILFNTTHESWMLFGPKIPENIILGASAHAERLHPTILAIINRSLAEGRDIIIEGVHITPSLLNKIRYRETYIFILAVSDKVRHLKFFDLKNSRRTVFHDSWYRNFPEIDIIQNYFTTEAARNKIPVIENIYLESTIDQIECVLNDNRLRLRAR